VRFVLDGNKANIQGGFAVSQVLDASCSVSPQTCGAVMDYYASQIVETTNCGLDYQAGNPTVFAAVTGLQNYLLYYEAGCLRNNQTNTYCMPPCWPRDSDKTGYTLAITNSTNPADAAAYYLPTIPLISGARPTCDECTQDLFEIYDIFSSNKTLDISQNYLQAAQVVDLTCGAGFVSLGKEIVSRGIRILADGKWVWSLAGLGLALIF
jgi:hypothetical protein